MTTLRGITILGLVLVGCGDQSNINMTNRIKHEPPADHLDPGIEYLFPVSVDDLESKHNALLTDWFSRFLSVDSDTVLDHLKSDWATEDSRTFSKFTRYLLTLTPTSIVFCDDRVWIALKNPSRESEVIMIHEPQTLSAEEAEFVESFGIADLEPFCRHFHDTYEYMSPYINGLCMEASPTSNESLGKLGEWEGGMYLYYICNGDAILLARSGLVGRWSHDIGWGDAPGYDRPVAVEKIANSFDEFIDRYIHQMKTGSLKEIFW